jgi:hypothetical protein
VQVKLSSEQRSSVGQVAISLNFAHKDRANELDSRNWQIEIEEPNSCQDSLASLNVHPPSAIEKYREAGATQLIVCDYSPDPPDTIRYFGRELIPRLDDA